MKRKSILFLFSAATFIISCNTNENEKKDVTATDVTTVNTTVDPDPTDSIPANGYASFNSNMETAAMIGKALSEDVLKNDISSIPADERKFKYHAIDLNNDKSDEYLVTPIGSYFCGTGGCSAYLLDHAGKLISSFSVTDFPVHVATTATDGWQDLIITSNGKNHAIKVKNGKYPSNPSVEPDFTGEVPMTPAVLNIYDAAYPAFNY